MFSWLVICLFLTAYTLNVSCDDNPEITHKMSRGWGDDIEWAQTYEEGLSKIKKSKKPAMVILHNDNCSHSQDLKKAFVMDKEIQKMAKENFIMVKVECGIVDKELSLDGMYVPKILFLDPSMMLRTDIMGKYSNYKYAYEPGDMDVLLNNMKKVKGLHRDL